MSWLREAEDVLEFSLYALLAAMALGGGEFHKPWLIVPCLPPVIWRLWRLCMDDVEPGDEDRQAWTAHLAELGPCHDAAQSPVYAREWFRAREEQRG